MNNESISTLSMPSRKSPQKMMRPGSRRDEVPWRVGRRGSVSTPFNELTFAHRGRKYSCRKESVPVMACGSAAAIKTHWIVEIGSLPFLAFDAKDGEDEDQVRQKVVLWDARGRIPGSGQV